MGRERENEDGHNRPSGPAMAGQNPSHPIFEIGLTSGAATTLSETTSLRWGTSQTRSTEGGEPAVDIQAAVLVAPAPTIRTIATELGSKAEMSVRHVGIDGNTLISSQTVPIREIEGVYYGGGRNSRPCFGSG